jgi:hypothetical protein
VLVIIFVIVARIIVGIHHDTGIFVVRIHAIVCRIEVFHAFHSFHRDCCHHDLPTRTLLHISDNDSSKLLTWNQTNGQKELMNTNTDIHDTLT